MSAGSETALMISSDFPPIPGGQSRFLYDLWSCLPPDQVVVLAPEVAGAAEVDAALECEVMRVPLPLGEGRLGKVCKAFRLLRWAWKLCRRRRVSAIHCGQVFSAGFAGYGCQMLRGVPYYLYAYGADLLEYRHRRLWGSVLERILQGARRVVVISEFTARVVEESGVERERIQMVFPAIDLERFAGEVDRDQVRRTCGWEGHRVVLSIGRLVERKGQDTVIRSLPQVAVAVPEVRYAIGGEGPFRERLEDLARAAGVAERVEFLGFVEEAQLPGLYAAADVFAMVSREILEAGDVEGFGIVYLEANAAGLPVIGGRSGGVEDAVVDGCTGLLVDPGDVDQVTRALIRLLQDGELRTELGRRGRERVRREFDRRVAAARLWEACS